MKNVYDTLFEKVKDPERSLLASLFLQPNDRDAATKLVGERKFKNRINRLVYRQFATSDLLTKNSTTDLLRFLMDGVGLTKAEATKYVVNLVTTKQIGPPVHFAEILSKYGD